MLDSNEDASTEWSGVGQDLKDEDFRTKLDEDIQRVISAVINGGNKTGDDLRGSILSEWTNSNGGTNANEAENIQVDIVDEFDEEVIELEFERAVEKMHTHDYEMYCPNCSNRISKVVLRRRKIAKRIPASSDTQQPKKDLFGCLSCFSIFINAGNKLNPFRIFGRKKEAEISTPLLQQQQTSNGLLSTSAIGSNVPRQDASDVNSSIPSSTQIKEQSIVTSVGSVGNSNGNDTLSQGKARLGSTATKVAAAVAIAGNRFQTSSLQGSVLNGHVNIDSEENLDGVIRGEKHEKPGSEIHEELNITGKEHQDNSSEANGGYNANGTIPNGKTHLGLTASKVAAAVAIAGKHFQNSSFQGSKPHGDLIIDINKNLDDVKKEVKHPANLKSEIKEETDIAYREESSRDVQVVIREESSRTETTQFTESTSVIKVAGIVREEPSSRSLEILKAIVYGGLMESIASLSIVSSAAASGTSTYKILALGLAYLISGLVVLGHNLRDLKYDELSETSEVENRYRELLGTRKHFGLHAVVAVLSYLIFGLIPPLTYAFTFRKSDDTDYKLLATSAVSLFCITILSISKAHTRGLRKFSEYFKAVLYYVTCAVMVGGIAYAVGDLGMKLMERLGWWDSSPVQGILFPETKSMNPPGFASY